MIIHYNNVKNLEILVNLIKKNTRLKNTNIKPFPSIRNMIKCLDVIIMNYYIKWNFVWVWKYYSIVGS